MDNISENAVLILANKDCISLDIARKVGVPITDEDVGILIEFAALLFDQELTFLPKNDYREYGKYADDDLPNFVPQSGKAGRKPKRPVRGFLKHFFPIVEYMMSSTHGCIEDRVGFEGQNKKLLTYDEKFQALNQIGKLAFLIAQQFYPDITIDGATDKSNNRDGDFLSILHPKGKLYPSPEGELFPNVRLRYDMTNRQVENIKQYENEKKKKRDEGIQKIAAKLSPAQMWTMTEKYPNSLAEFRKWLERNHPQ